MLPKALPAQGSLFWMNEFQIHPMRRPTRRERKWLAEHLQRFRTRAASLSGDASDLCDPVILNKVPGLVFPQLYKSVAGLVVLYAVGLPLAITAAVLSFRATLRHYTPKAARKSETIRCPGCGETLPPSAEQCPLCGHRLSLKE
jgi:DNA-directed RNA polymerase subunit RPC12/RpoP